MHIPGSAASRPGSARHLAACAGLLSLWCLPAHAFITLNFTPWDWVVIGLFFTWPYVLPVLLLILALMWRQRQEWRVTFRTVLAIAIVGSAVNLVYLVPEWMSDHRAKVEREFWERVDGAATAGKVDEATRMLEARGDNAMQEYVARLPGDPSLTPGEERLLKIAFGRCADLLRGGLLDIELLDSAIKDGQAALIEAWLSSPDCPQPDGTTREQRIAQIVYHLLPYTSSHDVEVERRRRAGQAAALRVLMSHYPALLDVDLSDFGCARYRGAYARCTVLAQLFDSGHDAGLMAVLPLDARAEQHLPAVAHHLLQGNASKAAVATRGDPVLFGRLLPVLMATVPIEGLRVALGSASLSEADLLSPQADESQYQRLSPLFEAAHWRDWGHDDWPFLWLLFERFPTRLAKVDRGLFDRYLLGTQPRDARVLKMLTTLRTAGMTCDQLSGLTRWGDQSADAVRWYADTTGCEETRR